MLVTSPFNLLIILPWPHGINSTKPDLCMCQKRISWLLATLMVKVAIVCFSIPLFKCFQGWYFEDLAGTLLRSETCFNIKLSSRTQVGMKTFSAPANLLSPDLFCFVFCEGLGIASTDVARCKK